MARRNPWILIILGIFGIGCVLGASVWAYWSYANQPPSYTPARVVMPVPNAYDDYRRAGAMAQAVGGTAVLLPGLTRPRPASRSLAAPAIPGLAPVGGAVMRNGQALQGYDDDATMEQVRAVVARNRPALARVRAGFHRACRCPPRLSSSQMFPELSGFRELARLLVTEGKLAEREGRMRDAAGSYLDCLRLGVEVPRGGVLIDGLVGIAIQMIGLNALDRAVDRMDAATAASTARNLYRLSERAPTVAEILAGEREFGAAALMETFRRPMTLRQIASMFSSGPAGRPSAGELLAALKYGFTPKRQILANQRSHMDALIADARKPYYARGPLPPPPSDPLNAILLPVFEQARFKWDLSQVQWRLLIVRLAMRAYQLQHGAPPPSLDALAPAYLPPVPRDPFANKPLVYRVQNGRSIVYSRGPDGDDDGGRDLGYTAQAGQDGDIVNMGSRPRGSGRRGGAGVR